MEDDQVTKTFFFLTVGSRSIEQNLYSVSSSTESYKRFYQVTLTNS
jgi:hypothetical protein